MRHTVSLSGREKYSLAVRTIMRETIDSDITSFSSCMRHPFLNLSFFHDRKAVRSSAEISLWSFLT